MGLPRVAYHDPFNGMHAVSASSKTIELGFEDLLPSPPVPFRPYAMDFSATLVLSWEGLAGSA